MVAQQGYSILIANDSPDIIAGLMSMLGGESLVRTIQSVSNGKEAIVKVAEGGIDCVLMDLNMPVLNGYKATEFIKQHSSDVKIVIISMWLDTQAITTLLSAGADAFLMKDVSKNELLIAIETVMQHNRYITKTQALRFFADPDTIHKLSANSKLNARESEIIRCIAKGKTMSQIAEQLSLSAHTVEAHRQNILAKLKLKNNDALRNYANENNLF